MFYFKDRIFKLGNSILRLYFSKYEVKLARIMGNQTSTQHTKSIKPITHKDFIETQEQLKQDMIASDLKCLTDYSGTILKKINEVIEAESQKPNRRESSNIGSISIHLHLSKVSAQEVVDKIAILITAFEDSGWFFYITTDNYYIRSYDIKLKNKRYPAVNKIALRINIYSKAQRKMGAAYATKPLLYTQDNCAICMDAPNPRYYFGPCGHQCVCEKCLNEYKDKDCPICKTPFDYTDKTPPPPPREEIRPPKIVD